MLDKVTIGLHMQKASSEAEKRALFIHYMDDFVANNMRVHLPFDEMSQRGKEIYTRLQPRFEEARIADTLINCPVTQLRLITKHLEHQKWLYHDDQRELEVYIDHEAWDKYVDKHDQNSDKLIVGFVSYINLHSLGAAQPMIGADPSHKVVTPSTGNGALAYGFLKLKFHQAHFLSQLPRNDFLDLVAYLKTALIDFYHERNEPAFLRLKCEQDDFYQFLPEEVKKHVPAPSE